MKGSWMSAYKCMSGRIRPGEEIVRNYDNQEPNAAARMAPALSKYAHAVIFVVKANDPRLTDGKYKDTLQKIREHFREDGYAPVAVITYLDKVKDNPEEKDEAFDQASWATGASGERTYFIANYVNVDAEQSFVVDRTALDILDSVLLSAERFIRIRKQREKNQMEREAMAGLPKAGRVWSSSLSVYRRSTIGPTRERRKLCWKKLRKEEIKTVKALKETVEDIKSELPLSIGMRLALEEEMKHI
ncbi:hypothetical protein OS493_039785 [Desmophyllum pertusum]|uniref:Uncharacterized protein n=1 Tax=Desmophyllum pertusum TaxID=174260 RepID=A0A9W9YH29_9CNID|nr:hypothetical protein OS493_039785 [Desmophyllum pertusum]